MMLLWGTQQLAVVAVSVPNYRSLGGIECAGGRVVRHNTILRSATPSNATAADVAYLRGTLQLASVVDLRAPVSRATALPPAATCEAASECM